MRLNGWLIIQNWRSILQSLWDDTLATQFTEDPLQLRIYTSRLIGKEPNLVLYGGGNTSVKMAGTNIFGETEELIYIKGSGWDLKRIEIAGFPAVKLQVLRRLAELDHLNDIDMVRSIKSAMIDPEAPTPSVEAILHAIIPYTFVDHTHADPIVTITNTDECSERIRDIYGDSMLIVPYVMPGFILAKKVFEMTRNIDWGKVEGIILLNHGIFTFDNHAKRSYEQMIKIVTKAEKYLDRKAKVFPTSHITPKEDLLELARIRRTVSICKGSPMIAKIDSCRKSIDFSLLSTLHSIATRGPLTPDHVIRTKRVPLIISGDVEENINRFAKTYHDYFTRYGNETLRSLDPAPRWAVWPGYGIVAFGSSIKDAEITSAITKHTIRAIQLAESLGGWHALPEKDIFDVEYWELEQAKLNKGKKVPKLQGKVAIVTGAASGIGRACVEKLRGEGAVVAALDIRSEVITFFNSSEVIGFQCDVTDRASIENCIKATVRRFGGLDILISNAGIFPGCESIAEISEDNWNQSLKINLSSHQHLLQICIPYLSLGIDPVVICIASKNVPAPGQSAAAYSVAKAGLTQLARIAALELGKLGIRVNVIHPDAVFDTGIWTSDLLKERANSYGISVNEYKKKNLLNVEITSKDVSALVCALAGSVFAKTTGAQIPIDGGNDRVI